MHETAAAEILITFGGLFLLGLAADVLGRHTPLPRVTLLLVSGFVIGPSVLNWMPAFTIEWFPVLTNVALAMIGFLLGQNLNARRFRELGRAVLTISLSVVLVSVALMFSVLVLFGVPPEIALLLAGIAPATDPAATVDVVNEVDARGPFTKLLLGIVAIDDAWGLMVFTVLLAVAQLLAGNGSTMSVLQTGLWELGGAVALGLAIGLPMAFLTGRIRKGEPIQAEALGGVLLTAGLAEWYGVSYILSAIVLGATVSNLAHHHKRPFRAIKGIEWPFLVLFFLLAGAGLRLDELLTAGWLAVGYMVLRVIGRIVGAWLGARAGRSDDATRKWMGLALMPQAGVAVGMALLASQRFPEIRDVILPVALGATVVFELIGPITTRWALRRAGQTPQ